MQNEKKITRVVFTFLFVLVWINSSFSQNRFSVKQLEQIKQKVEKQIPSLKTQLISKGYTPFQIEFSVDTFRIEQTCREKMSLDYSTSGLTIAVGELSDEYDRLMNKYYTILKQLMKPQDKQILLNAQRAWLNYRDNESKLIMELVDEKYSGGGTIQSNISVGNHLNLVKKRTLEIYDHIMSIKQYQ